MVSGDPQKVSVIMFVCFGERLFCAHGALLCRLSMFDTILKALKRVGNCHRFIKHCCPEEYAEEFDLSNRKVLELPVSAVWMESIAIKLGTFWALPERTFLEECLLACDPSGKRHAKWLSLLFLSCHPVLYSKREQLQHSRSFDFSQGSESVEHADSIHESGEENLFDLNGDATTLLPDGFQIGSNKHQCESLVFFFSLFSCHSCCHLFLVSSCEFGKSNSK